METEGTTNPPLSQAEASRQCRVANVRPMSYGTDCVMKSSSFENFISCCVYKLRIL